MGFYTLQSRQGSSSEDRPKRMSPSAVPPQRNRVVTSNCSEGPDCPSRVHRRTPDPGPVPPGGTPRCLTFTLADHRRSGRAHPHLQVSAENAEEAELDPRGAGPGRKGREGAESRLRPEGHTWLESRAEYTAQARRVPAVVGRRRVLLFSKLRVEDSQV